MSNSSLNAAKAAKDDEFYTSLSDVEKEMQYYKAHFKGKTVFCNCDDPEWSAFWQYFSLNFKHLGLKRLVSTHYEPGGPSYRLDISEYGQQTLPMALEGDGDFRSDECLAILDECDIVCTNPPFSLFREFISVLVAHGKEFIVLGNMNAITYKEIFPLIRDGRLWLGPPACNGAKTYRRPDGSDRKLGNTMWYTNIDHAQRHEPLILCRKYTPEEYPTYDNYDAIEVSRTSDIPMDYTGPMGVPVSYLDKHNPEQFDIIDRNNGPVIDGKGTYKRIIIKAKRNGVMGVPISFLDRYCPEQFVLIGTTASWDESEEMQRIKTSATKRHGPFINGKECYRRLLIRRR